MFSDKCMVTPPRGTASLEKGAEYLKRKVSRVAEEEGLQRARGGAIHVATSEREQKNNYC